MRQVSISFLRFLSLRGGLSSHKDVASFLFQSHSWDSYHWEHRRSIRYWYTQSIYPCFNLILEILIIERGESSSLPRNPLRFYECFNLILEILIIESRRAAMLLIMTHHEISFQSHSWDSYHWEWCIQARLSISGYSFNLILEILIIESTDGFYLQLDIGDVSISFLRFLSLRVKGCKQLRRWADEFQSHSWDSYHWEACLTDFLSFSDTQVSISFLRFLSLRVHGSPLGIAASLICFNLILEILIIERCSLFRKDLFQVCFNLILEILIIERYISRYFDITRLKVSISFLRFLSLRVRKSLLKVSVKRLVSISFLRFLSLRGFHRTHWRWRQSYVSISFLRFLSLRASTTYRSTWFDTSRFNLILEILIIESFLQRRRHRLGRKVFVVSISFLRFLSLRVLAQLSIQRGAYFRFQSHSWDSYHWERKQRFRGVRMLRSFNLILEILIIESGFDHNNEMADSWRVSISFLRFLSLRA